jgi:predicted nucleotidyltransferase
MQEDWQTLSSIKTSEVARIAAGVNVLKKALSDYARMHAGTFFIYGSVAKGTLRHDSDIDILVDFPSECISDAWRFCEDACRQQGLTPDVRPKSLCSSKFLEKALIGAVELTGER